MENSPSQSLEEQLVDKLQRVEKTPKHISGYLDKDVNFYEMESILHIHGYRFSTRSSKSFIRRDRVQAHGTRHVTDECKVEVENVNQVAVNPTRHGASGKRDNDSHHMDRKVSLMFQSKPCIPDMGVPFNMVKVIHKDCKYGTPYWKHCKDVSQESNDMGLSSDHERYVKKQRQSHNSVKKDCRASMIIRELQVYPDYSIEEQKSNWGRRKAKEATIQKLHRDLNSSTPPKSFTRYWVTIPLSKCHNEHPLEGSSRTLHPDDENSCEPETVTSNVEDVVTVDDDIATVPGVIETSEVYMDIECETEIVSSNLRPEETVRPEEIMDSVETITELKETSTVQSNQFAAEEVPFKEFESDKSLSVLAPAEVFANSLNVVAEECQTEEVVTDSLCENKILNGDTQQEYRMDEIPSASNEYEAVEPELSKIVHDNAVQECMERIKGYLAVIDSLTDHCGDITLLNNVEGDLKRVLERFPVMGMIGH